MLFSPVKMHIPDGFLSLAASLLAWLIAVAGIAYALKRVNQQTGERQAPLMGVLAAAIFAGQMLNFSVAGGTSGHLLGAALATVVLGPWAAILVMTCVVGVQAFIFQDGGIWALGANICNMALIGSLVTYFVYNSLKKLTGQHRWGLGVAGFAAGWSSIMAAALACALELAVSGTSPADMAVPAMAGIHALIGVGEGLITVGALSFIYAVRPQWLTQTAPPARESRWIWAVGLLLALSLTLLAPWASTHPDGLEWVAEQQGFLQTARAPLYNLIPDYVLPGISNENLATILAGMLGVVMVFSATLSAAAFRQRHRDSSSSKPA